MNTQTLKRPLPQVMAQKIAVALMLIFFCHGALLAQETMEKLPLFHENEVKYPHDWLIKKEGAKAKLYRDNQYHLVFSNGLIARTFTQTPDAATIDYKNLSTGESLIRSVRPEGAVTINGIHIGVGGLYGQPIQNYLLPEWVAQMKPGKGAFHYDSYTLKDIKPRFNWKKRASWMPGDLPWPPPGKELTLRFNLDDADLAEIFKKSMSDDMRTTLYSDDFTDLDAAWRIVKSDAHPRTSFINEGKPGEIMALANTYAFAERPIPKSARVIIVQIDPGTDQSKIFGPGVALVLGDQVIKVNLRTSENRFGFFDGHKTTFTNGLRRGKPVILRLERTGQNLIASYSYDQKSWTQLGKTTLKSTKKPWMLRVGKTDWVGASSDHPEPGKLIRCHINAIHIYGDIPQKTRENSFAAIQYLKDIHVLVHYNLYDHLPLMCKWITVENNTDKTITIDHFKSEILAVTDAESNVDQPDIWRRSKLYVETDYAFGDGMSPASCLGKSMFWNTDPAYLTQVNYNRKAPYLLECYPKYGPAQQVMPGSRFDSFRTWEMAQKNYDRERQGLERRKMYRTIAPWITENPILMHVRQADNEAVKLAIDQCADVGFEMVIMTFGSGFNVENQSSENLLRMKKLADYAHAKGIALGGYSLLASRSIDSLNDVVLPAGEKPTFGHSPCLESTWGQNYFEELYNFYENTGQDILEHDGSYPGDPCYSTNHPGHKGLADSQWNQRRRITDFYKWCRGQGIYLNVPDWYFLNGSNKTGMGYRETNWSLPRKQQEIIERQNVYDGTWNKTPSMGWMFVPLVQYHGGGDAATIEPLKDHLPHYEQRLANLFGNGVQACYRGPRLYDAPETRAIVKKWVDFYKAHRGILDSDVIHVRRPDGRDFDGMLHVNPELEEKGLLMLYNPLEEPISKTIQINLYYTGLGNTAHISENDGPEKSFKIQRDYTVDLPIEIPARGWSWYVIK